MTRQEWLDMLEQSIVSGAAATNQGLRDQYMAERAEMLAYDRDLVSSLTDDQVDQANKQRKLVTQNRMAQQRNEHLA